MTGKRNWSEDFNVNSMWSRALHSPRTFDPQKIPLCLSSQILSYHKTGTPQAPRCPLSSPTTHITVSSLSRKDGKQLRALSGLSLGEGVDEKGVTAHGFSLDLGCRGHENPLSTGKTMLSTTNTCKRLIVSYIFPPCAACLVIQSCLTLCKPMDCSPPGSSVHRDCPGKNTGVGCRALLQEIFAIQGFILDLLHCRWILYHLSHQGSPNMYLIIA